MTPPEDSRARSEPGPITKLPKWAFVLGVLVLAVALLLSRACERQRAVDVDTAHAVVDVITGELVLSV